MLSFNRLMSIFVNSLVGRIIIINCNVSPSWASSGKFTNLNYNVLLLHYSFVTLPEEAQVTSQLFCQQVMCVTIQK